MDINFFKNWFDTWNNIKKQLHLRNKKIYFKEREIWWASVGANIGYEENGKNSDYERPVLIYKKFNKDLIWAIPMTSKSKDNKYYFIISTNSVVILSQLRSFSSKRLIRKMGIISPEIHSEIKNRLIELL